MVAFGGLKLWLMNIRLMMEYQYTIVLKEITLHYNKVLQNKYTLSSIEQNSWVKNIGIISGNLLSLCFFDEFI
jgi:hypothetical protein